MKKQTNWISRGTSKRSKIGKKKGWTYEKNIPFTGAVIKGGSKKTGQTLFVIMTKFLILQKSLLYFQKGHIHSFQN